MIERRQTEQRRDHVVYVRSAVIVLCVLPWRHDSQRRTAEDHEKLTAELARLREALRRLEGEARSRVSAARRRRTPATDRAAGAATTGAAKPAGTRTRAPRGQNKARVLEALKDGPMTASEIAKVTGIATGTVSTLLTRMAKSGELAKADRGYTLPQ